MFQGLLREVLGGSGGASGPDLGKMSLCPVQTAPRTGVPRCRLTPAAAPLPSPGPEGENLPTQIPGPEGGEAAPVGLHQHQEVAAHLLRCVHRPALLRAQQVPHDPGGLPLPGWRQHAVEDAVDHVLRVPEEVQRPWRHVLRAEAPLRAEEVEEEGQEEGGGARTLWGEGGGKGMTNSGCMLLDETV